MDSGIGTMILLIAGMVVATGVVSVVIPLSDSLSNSLEDLGESQSEILRTDVKIISDESAGAIYESGTVTLLVKNTGMTELEPNEATVQIDGEFVPIDSATVVDGDRWETDNVVRLKLSKNLTTGEEHIFLVDVNGNTDSITTVITNG